nr:hypothetical protein [Tanacetum cinerariifolium]
MLDHQDKYMMKAQVHVSKSSAIFDVQPLSRRKHHCQIYQVVKHMLRGRLLASFQDREHEGGNTRSQDGIKDNDSKIKIQDHSMQKKFPRTRLKVSRKAHLNDHSLGGDYLGKAAFILGIKIYQDRSKRLIRLSQSAYMDKILKRYRMANSKRDYIPINPEAKLRVDCYCNAVFETNMDEIKSQTGYVFILNGESHWTAMKTILKHLRNTKDMFLVYGRNPEAELRVDCYCNAGFETNRDEIKSQTGYVFILNGRRNRLEKLQVKYYCNVHYRN